MKRLAASLVLATALALLPAQAAPADITYLSAGVFPDDELAALSSSGDPFAVGGGTVGTTQFAFSAHCATAFCAPDSGTASGYAVVSDPTLGEAQGHVCSYFTPSTKVAVFSIDVEKASGVFGLTPALFFLAEDLGGQPPSSTADEMEIRGTDGCGVPVVPLTSGPVVQGNIVVEP
jgi:hypothetical protein